MIENQLGDNDQIYGVFDFGKVINEFPPDPDKHARHRAEILVKTDTLRVVLVTMLAGGKLQDHSAPGPITIQTLKGTFDVTYEGGSERLSEGQMISMAPGVMHGVEGVEAGAFLLTIAHLSRVPDTGGSNE